MNRSSRALPATLVALLLLGGAGYAAVEIIARLAGHPGWFPASSVTNWAASTRWSSLEWTVGSGVVALCGGWLLLLAALPGHGRLIWLHSDNDQVRVATTRHGLRHAVAVAAAQVEGVDSAETRLRRRRITVTARSHLADTGDIGAAATAAAEQRIAALAPSKALRVRVRVRRTRTDVPLIKSVTGPRAIPAGSGEVAS